MTTAEYIGNNQIRSDTRAFRTLVPAFEELREKLETLTELRSVNRGGAYLSLAPLSQLHEVLFAEEAPMIKPDMAAVLKSSITECEVAYGSAPEVSVPAEHARQVVSYMAAIAPQALYAAYIEYDPEEDLPYTAVVEMEHGEKALLIAIDDEMCITRQVGMRSDSPTWEHFTYDIGDMQGIDQSLAWLTENGG
jgi:hypothetical protein